MRSTVSSDRTVTHKWHGALVLAVGVVLMLGVGQTNFGHSILQKAGLYEVPAGFTWLAFVKPQSLHEQLKTKRATIDVSFEIGNNNNNTRNYKWSLSTAQAGNTHNIADGSISVASEHRTIVKQPTEINCVGGQTKIVVSLTGLNEHIDALMACAPSRS